MPSLLERLTAQAAFVHARRVFGAFIRSTHDVRAVQVNVLRTLLRRNANSDFGRRYDFAGIASIRDFRGAVPLQTYEDLRPFIERVMDGDESALFRPGENVRMFATTSGSTDKPKYVPVTPDFIREYRRGWNTFGCKMLTDHPAAVLRGILQSSGRFDESRTAAGTPCGAITGLLARTQKRIVRRFYVGHPRIAEIADARARHYALMRLAIARDVAFAVTANPATLIQMARVANEESETLIRDVRDGTLSTRLVADPVLHAVLAARCRPDPARSAELARLRAAKDLLRPRDYWRLEFLACWIGGSMGLYLDRLREWWGALPVRDVGLLASEGRVTVPLDDNVPAGVLDSPGAFFEFIPLGVADQRQPETRLAWELEDGADYAIVLTNAAGLTRYRLDDVVRVRGRMNGAPVLEFLHRAGRVASVAGEKLTENQVVAAMAEACRRSAVSEFDYLFCPCWTDPPSYRLSCEIDPPADFAVTVDALLSELNSEYASRRKSARLGPIAIRSISAGAILAADARIIAARLGKAEQYKRQCLLTTVGEDSRILSISNEPPG